VVDYYKILGLNRDASQEDIKKSFRKLAVEYHPDKGGDEEKFKKINEAYSVLSDPQKKHQYDNPTPNLNIFEEMMSRGNPFGFGGDPRRGRPSNVPSKGADLKFVIDVPLKNFIFGGEQTISISYEEACSSCNGKGYEESSTCELCGGSGRRTEETRTGSVYMRKTVGCYNCNGRGEVGTVECRDCLGSGKHNVENREIEIPIQKGTRDGSGVVLRQRGRKGVFGGPNGNIHIIFKMNLPNPDSLTEKQKKVLEEL